MLGHRNAKGSVPQQPTSAVFFGEYYCVLFKPLHPCVDDLRWCIKYTKTFLGVPLAISRATDCRRTQEACDLYGGEKFWTSPASVDVKFRPFINTFDKKLRRFVSPML